jgi:nicotinamide-nucleotide amidase
MAEALDPALPPATDRLARQVLEDACARELKLVTAESCTGGLLASLLTDIPGCSHAFERGFVTYTDEEKHELLGVPMAILIKDGAVSERSARAMAEGALANSRGDIAVAVTGFTESGPVPDQPGGLVHFAAARRGGATDHRVMRFGEVGRADVRLKALDVALDMLRIQITETANAA